MGLTAGRGRQDRAAKRRAAPQAGVPLSAGATHPERGCAPTVRRPARAGCIVSSAVPNSAIARLQARLLDPGGGVLRPAAGQHPAGLRLAGRRQGRVPLLRQPPGQHGQPARAAPPGHRGPHAPRSAGAGGAGHHQPRLHHPPGDAGHRSHRQPPGRAAGPDAAQRLAFTPQGLPLGILHIECWARDPPDFRSSPGTASARSATASRSRTKESSKWLRALGRSAQTAARCPNTRVVVLSDREFDIYEYLLAAQQQGRDVVLRGQREAARAERRAPPIVAASAAVPCGRHGRAAGAAPGQAAGADRHAGAALPAGDAATARRQAGPAVGPGWAVLAREPNPPPEVRQALEWLLLTSVPVTRPGRRHRASAVVCRALGHRHGRSGSQSPARAPECAMPR